ncbi:serine/threonine-protein kinase [Hyalangium sp.]|uniref:serine/threonine-protein kinase n=1 Tax=Hyalangium sp. TaxID=2028555 RepID=UPI002D5AC3A3|nr:serine/threonine-protein kinase [Hyalangium sp.]HYI02375.1 serine/threonine-protein kinase [Hyalangium sp.]
MPLEESTVILTRAPVTPPAAAPARAEPPPADEPELRTEKVTRPPEVAALAPVPRSEQGVPTTPVPRKEPAPQPPSPAPRRGQGATPPAGMPRAPTPQRPTGPRSATRSPLATGSRPSLPAPAPPLDESLTEPVPSLQSLDRHGTSLDRHGTALSHGMRLGGYQLLRKLGAGAMGTVWLARQLSLARDVALKILRPSLARDPQFVYRFTQEAFAAAQLVHHNIVQIYDCGSEKQIYFYSMEYVDAENLQSLITREGRLDPEVAAGYILQAARGLKFAHDMGMVHRDIKPDNLLLNRNGIVKVADMGLVKRSGQEPGAGDRTELHPLQGPAQEPQASDSGGTPAYMSPEQVENSPDVDARADIYSLGCTFYFLLTGRPPFQSESVAAMMGMHVMEPPIPPEELVRRVPKALSDIVLRMLAKLPEERFQNLGGLIRELEAFLGIEGTTAFSPREEHANLLERCVLEYNRAPWGSRRRAAVLGFAGVSAVATGLAAWRGGPLVAAAVAAFSASTWMLSFTLRGLFHNGTLFLHLRQFILSAPLGTWLVWLLLLGGAGYGLYRFGLLVLAAGLLGGALLAASGFYFLVDRMVAAERQPFIEEVEVMLRSMRLRGLEEGALRQFVCKYSGDVWESFYEALFGYEAKLLAREKWGRNERGLPRQTHAAWRDPLIRGMDLLQQARKHRRERRQLRMLERKKEKAQDREKAQAAPT